MRTRFVCCEISSMAKLSSILCGFRVLFINKIYSGKNWSDSSKSKIRIRKVKIMQKLTRVIILTLMLTSKGNILSTNKVGKYISYPNIFFTQNFFTSIEEFLHQKTIFTPKKQFFTPKNNFYNKKQFLNQKKTIFTTKTIFTPKKQFLHQKTIFTPKNNFYIKQNFYPNNNYYVIMFCTPKT